jgi:hypothetical protein
VILFALLVLIALPASADEGAGPSGGGVLDGNTILVGIIAPGSTGGAGGAPGSGDVAPYRYVWIPADTSGSSGNGLENTCPTGDPGNPWGWVYTLVVQDLDGNVVRTERRCVPLNPDGSIPPAPESPPVPSIADIWRAALAQIGPPTLGVNPEPVGLTGLETWFWYDGSSTVAVSVSLQGWTVTGTAHLSEVAIDTGDGGTAVATAPGSHTEPAARHVYETKGAYDLTITARWEADVVLSGPGLPARPTPIGAAVLRTSRTYPVQEVRSLLVEP